MVNPQPQVRFLHISDLAFDGDRSADPVALGLIDCVQGLADEGLAPDLVAITGDVVASGRAEQFAQAADWIEKALLPAAGLGRDALFLVPGERDIAADRVNRAARALREDLLQAGQDAIAEVLADPAQRAIMLTRLEPWLAFASGLLGRKLDVPWFSDQRTLRGVTVGIAGLCSAWAAEAAAGDHGHLLVGAWQVNTVLEPMRKADLRVVLAHHPPGWLHAADGATEQRLARGADLLLRGHDPQPVARTLGYPPDTLVEVVAGPGRLPGYAAQGEATFALVEAGPGGVRVLPYTWVRSAHGWKRDRNREPLETVVFTVPPPPVAKAPRVTLRPPPPLADLPDHPYPVLGPCEHAATFGGRDADLADLVAVLGRDRLVTTVHAPSGAGKSSLLRAGLLPLLRGHTGLPAVPVAFDDHPALAGLAGKCLRQVADGEVADSRPPDMVLVNRR